MFDIGLMEFVVIAVVAVLILGPDRLPKAIAEGARWLRALRDQAANARRDIVAAADLDPTITDDLRRSVQDLAELHPKRIASSILSDSGAATAPPPPPAPVNGFGASATSTSLGPRPADAAPSSGPAAAPAAFDPDAT